MLLMPLVGYAYYQYPIVAPEPVKEWSTPSEA
jgi:hypothetical protein